MKMRELEERTGVRREMIHFYFRNDLLPEPERPKPNVAVYGEEHVRSILAIRRLQTEQRLTIDEIKSALNGDNVALKANAHTFQHLDELVAARLGADQSLVPLSSLLESSAGAVEDAEVLQEMGAIELLERDGETLISRLDAQIVLTWGDMRAHGFNEALGFGPHLVEIYLERARDLAQAEIAAYLERVPHFSREKKAEWAQPGLSLMGNIFLLLRMKANIAEFRKEED